MILLQKWEKGSPNSGFLCAAAPGLDLKRTCLCIAYKGKPANPPKQVTGLNVFHRSGQTFITFKEIDDPIGKDEIPWGAFRKAEQIIEKIS